MTEKFFEAIRGGERAAVERRLRLSPGLIHARDASGLPPVLVAMYHHHIDVAKLLADQAVALDIHEAAATGRTNHLIRILAKRPDLVNAYAGDGFQPLGLACFFGHLEAADYLIKAGGRVNSPSRNEMQVTPLHSAAAGGHTRIVKLLLKHSADPNARQQGDFTPLHAAAQNGEPDMIRVLLFHGADAEARTSEGKTPIDYASQGRKTQAVKLLKERITKRLRGRKPA
jgi:ankyrin repeat protein